MARFTFLLSWGCLQSLSRGVYLHGLQSIKLCGLFLKMMSGCLYSGLAGVASDSATDTVSALFVTTTI